MVRCILSCCFVFNLAFVLSSGELRAQNTNETVNAPGKFFKLLTPSLIDRWSFQGKTNQIILVSVWTDEFDSVVELVKMDGEAEKVLVEMDDPGSNCAMLFRLPADGEYKLRVHGFENKGGGNYQLELQQFQAAPIILNENASGVLDAKGKAHFYFTAVDDSFAFLQHKGISTISSQYRNAKGEPILTWETLVAFEKGGEHLLDLSGAPGARFEFALNTVPRLGLIEGKKLSQKLPAKSPCVFDIEATKGTFRVIEVESTRPIASHIVYAPRKREDASRIETDEVNEPLRYLPIGSKGLVKRYAVMFGRTERFQLRLSAGVATTVNVDIQDVVTQLDADQIVRDQLVVGSTRFYQVKREQGKTLVVRAESSQFDTKLEMFDAAGKVIVTDDDGGEGLNSQITQLSYKPDLSLLAVSSVGNGGGGAFELSLKTQVAKEIQIGPTYSGNGKSGSDQWLLQGTEGQMVVFFVQGASSAPQVRLLSPTGQQLFSSSTEDTSFNTVFAFGFPKTEKYNVLVSTSESDYKMQLFEPKK